MISLNEQTFRDFEVVFVDNASTDHSIRKLHYLLKSECFRHLKVQIIINRSNLGYCAGNNIGLAHASGDYIVFLNNDVFVEPTWLKELVEVLDSDPSVGACQSLVLFALNQEVQSAGMMLDVYGWSYGIPVKEYANVMEGGIFYPMGTSVIVRRSILDACKGFDELVFSGDYDLGWRIRLYGYKIATSTRSVCHHYGGHATRALYAHPEQYYEACKERIYVLLKNYSITRIALRIPVSTVFMFFGTTVWSWRTRKNYLTSLSKAIIWNLKNFQKLAAERKRIQRERKIPDKEIENAMSHYPLMILLARLPPRRKITERIR
jgi:GT2 family glycosyltransferase